MQAAEKRRPLFERLVLGFVVLTCARVWIGPVEVERTAEAQLPNQGASLTTIATETQRTRQLLTEIKQLLQSMKTHTYNVKVVGATVETSGGK